ncbi:MAG: 4-(cytidine 5'-diphospho)-2-C-methyl-D-erythritol kinase [Arenicellales bacterium]
MQLDSKIWLAPAKLNLFLHVTGRQPDGYHTLQTAFVFLDYYDQLQFEVNETGAISRVDVDGGLEIELPKDDLCAQAAKLLQAHSGTSQGAIIHLKKNLPAGAGLGGGSSDAATVLIALNELWQTNLSREALIELGRSLGADVPVFLHGENAWAEGVGDVFFPLETQDRAYCVLIPKITVSTAQVFSDSALTRDTPIKKIRGSLLASDFEAPNSGFSNDLEAVTCHHFPEVRLALDYLSGFGYARMSGTGASVFLACDTLQAAEKIIQQCPLKSLDVNGFVAQSLARHPHITV